MDCLRTSSVSKNVDLKIIPKIAVYKKMKNLLIDKNSDNASIILFKIVVFCKKQTSGEKPKVLFYIRDHSPWIRIQFF